MSELWVSYTMWHHIVTNWLHMYIKKKDKYENAMEKKGKVFNDLGLK